MTVKTMSDEDLIEEWKSLNEIVDRHNGSYHTQEIVRFHLLSRELEKRGYRIIIERILERK